MKHTKGPWNFSRMGDSGWILAGKTYIAEIITADDEDCYVRDMDKQDSNAHLIAAAPKLLEACKYVVQYHRENDSGEGELFGLDFVTTCINAIREAETNI